ncbi:di-N-acetylchitobiase [Patella vulgata]|uniref:di-N-acetylchitobiase n=1 Tax=Patella vulgata TaxID=6465 RepID=UPI00217F2DB8|nr:di-N-acetylchitobiase [Patella vulgata]
MIIKIVLVVCSLLVIVEGETCPCHDAPDLCNPIKDTTRKEVFAFSVKNDTNYWLKYNLTKVTTIVACGGYNRLLLCIAHTLGIRVVRLVDFPVTTLMNKTDQEVWINNTLADVRTHFWDGINIDFESAIDVVKVAKELTSFVTNIYQRFKQEFPYFQITIDVPYKQPCVYNRCFEYAALSKVTDFFVVMAYDEHSGRTAGANSPLGNEEIGIKSYLSINIPKSKLVYAAPWYGYRFRCSKFLKNQCVIGEQKPFRGKRPFGSAAESEIPYIDIANLIETKHITVNFDNATMTPFFTYQEADNTTYQIWFDDAQSLKLKYDMAVQFGLRGVSMWTADSIDYNNTVSALEQRREIWRTIPSYGIE